MARKGRRRRRVPLVAEINITNLVDVTLTLLVVFMIVAPLLKQGLEIELPETAVAQDLATDEQIILVEVNKDGMVNVNGETVLPGAVEETVRALREEFGEVDVQLRADKSLAYGDVVGIYANIVKAGVERVDVETRKWSSEE